MDHIDHPQDDPDDDGEAVISLFSPSGRIGRADYIFGMIIAFILWGISSFMIGGLFSSAGTIAAALDGGSDGSGFRVAGFILQATAYAVSLYVSTVLDARRLRDLSLKGRWAFVILVLALISSIAMVTGKSLGSSIVVAVATIVLQPLVMLVRIGLMLLPGSPAGVEIVSAPGTAADGASSSAFA